MPGLKAIFDPWSYLKYTRRILHKIELRLRPNLRYAIRFPPGHAYSPLLDIRSLGPDDLGMQFDGAELWEHIDLQPEEQRSYYEDLIERFPLPPFPGRRTPGYRYFTDNTWFPLADAFTLSGIIRKEKPLRIVEVGSGFSSAVILDTLGLTRTSAELTLVEPDPDRLFSLLLPEDRSASNILVKKVQEVQMSVFDQLGSQDILFIDSSHVAKIGSDVAFIFLRVLPRLKKGVLVHLHDIFYPYSYPAKWIREGRAWNESLFLRAFLAGNPDYRIVVFNSYAEDCFPELFRERFPAFLYNTSGSIWIRKVK